MSFADAATALVDDVGHPVASEHAGSTLSSGDRRRLLHSSTRVSRAFVLSAALLSVSAVLAGAAALPTLQARFAAPVLRYAVASASTGALGAGEPLPLIVTRCVDDPALGGQRGGYDLSRALVAADEATSAALVQAFGTDNLEPGPPARLVLPGTFADTGSGCEQRVTTRTVLPASTPAGSYYLEGVARYVGPSGRSGSAYWRSDVFSVAGGNSP